MTLKYSSKRAFEIVQNLPEGISRSDIFTFKEKPDYSPPHGVKQGSLEHVIFLTLTLTIDTGCDSPALWNSARKAYEGENTRYLFSPVSLYEDDADQILYDLRNLGLCGSKNKNSEIWKNAGTFLFQKWGGDPRNFLRSCEWDAKEILNRIIPARYLEVYDFYHFISDKKGQLWLSLLKGEVGLDQIKNLDNVPLITDIHVVRASIALGIIYGTYSGQISVLSPKVRELWEVAIHEVQESGGMTTFELSEALRNISKNGCYQRDGKRIVCPRFEHCPLSRFCAKGIYSLDNKGVFIDTTKEGTDIH
ncbi:MAG TPA: hypothetical protein VN372_11700 [Methanospirillum sp.]|nr:hypothetical protein [Methanospirillum sp.]